jgi:hypothetical protein
MKGHGYDQDDDRTVFDVHYEDGRVQRRVSLSQGLEVGEQLHEGQWVVEQVVPSPDPGLDFEAYVRRVRPGEFPAPILNYLVIKLSRESEPSHESHRAVGLLSPGDTIWLGVERWRVIQVKERRGLVLFDGVVAAARDH